METQAWQIQMNKKILTVFLMSIFLLSFASAVCQDGEGNLGSKKQNECVRISQTCATCTYVNISSISLTTSNETIYSNIAMIDSGSGEWVYQFCNTTDLGSYNVRGMGDLDGVDNSFVSCFDITPSGQSGTENIIFFLFVILMIYGITFTGFFGKNIPITILGGMAMIFLGVYIVNSGLIIYRDVLTNYFSYLTIGLGVIVVFWALLENFDII